VCHFVAEHVIVRLGEEMSNVADGVHRRRRRNVVLPTGLRGDLVAVDGAEVNLRSHHRDPLSQTSH
jgi:hypothetical protein